MSATDKNELWDMQRESAELQFWIVARGRDVAELKTEVDRLEKELGVAVADPQAK